MQPHLTIGFLVLFCISIDASANQYTDASPIHWSLIIENDGKVSQLQGSQINEIKADQLINRHLKANCQISFKKNVYAYDPIKVTYAREEEVTRISCQMGDTRIGLGDIRCAKSRAKNDAGTIYSDDQEIELTGKPNHLKIKMKCAVK